MITFPTVCAHILGQLLKFMGEDRIVFGSDAVWYGSPQWQIEALWRFQIPEEMCRRYGYPRLTPQIKRKILGLNSARLYGLQPPHNTVSPAVYKPVPEDYADHITPRAQADPRGPERSAEGVGARKPVRAIRGRRPREDQAGVHGSRRHAQQHALRLAEDAGLGVRFNLLAGETGLS